MANQNITLSLSPELLQMARTLADDRRTTVSNLLAEMLKDAVERETGCAPVRERGLATLVADHDLGTGGHLAWTRDDIHER